jgi:hypothetical protein
VNPSDSGKDKMVGCCEHDDERSVSIKARNFLSTMDSFKEALLQGTIYRKMWRPQKEVKKIHVLLVTFP